MSLENLPRPTIRLSGSDGNCFAILGVMKKALVKAGWNSTQVAEFLAEAMDGDYDELLVTCCKYADCK